MALPPELSRMLEQELEEMKRRKKFLKNQSQKIDERKIASKVLSDYQAEKRHEEALSKIRRLRSQEKYESSRSGRFTRKVVATARFVKSPSRSLYNKTRKVSFSPEAKRRMEVIRARYLQQQQTPQQRYFDYAFSNFGKSYNPVGEVEREISSANGYASEGNFESQVVDRIASSVGSNMTAFPILSIDQQVKALSNFQDVGANISVDREVDFHSNILSTSPKRKK